MREFHADPISEGHSPAAPTLSPPPSEIKASEKETIPDAYIHHSPFCLTRDPSQSRPLIRNGESYRISTVPTI